MKFYDLTIEDDDQIEELILSNYGLVEALKNVLIKGN